MNGAGQQPPAGAEPPTQPAADAADAAAADDDVAVYAVVSPITLKRLNKGCTTMMYACELGHADGIAHELRQSVSDGANRCGGRERARIMLCVYNYGDCEACPDSVAGDIDIISWC